jgi:hypothetical protein
VSLNYIPVIEKITTRNGKEEIVEWKGRIINVHGFKAADPSREVVEDAIRTRLQTALFNKTEV